MNPAYVLAQIKGLEESLKELLEPMDEEEMDEGSFYS
jgi:hypothetical protein